MAKKTGIIASVAVIAVVTAAACIIGYRAEKAPEPPEPSGTLAGPQPPVTDASDQTEQEQQTAQEPSDTEPQADPTGTEENKPVQGKEETPPPVENPATPDTPAPEPVTSAPEQPEQTDTGKSVILYVPDAGGAAFNPVETQVKDTSDQSLVEALIAAGALPEGIQINASAVKDGVLTLDMNAAYGQAVRSSGTVGESMLLYALVNTFAKERQVTRVAITVDGKTLESGHEVYDYPLEATI